MVYLPNVVFVGMTILLFGGPQPACSHSLHDEAEPEYHHCLHDLPRFRAEKAALRAAGYVVNADYGVPPAADSASRAFHATAASPIRITFDYTALSTDGSFCAVASDIVPSMMSSGEMSTCADADVMTRTKRELLKFNVLPAVAARLQKVISVQPIIGNLKVPSSTVCGSQWPVPESHTAVGLTDTDLLIYVASVPINTNTASAFAAACASDTRGRAVIGRLNVIPSRLRWTDGTTYDDRKLVDLILHEVTHVLGVSSESFDAVNATTVRRRGKYTRIVTTPTVVSFVRKYTGCATLEGGEIEDEGGSGVAGSHWERKVWLDEIMAPIPGSTLSGLSLALLQDLQVGYSVNLDGEQGMRWGAKWGCGIHLYVCGIPLGGAGQYYCTGTATDCTATNDATGRCYENQPYMDGCGYVRAYANRICTESRALSTITASELTVGMAYSPNSRCYARSSLAQVGFRTDAGERCLVSTCYQGVLHFRVAGSGWLRCPAGSKKSVPSSTGFTGDVMCPTSTSLCDGLPDGLAGGSLLVDPKATDPPVSTAAALTTEPAPTVEDESVAAFLTSAPCVIVSVPALLLLFWEL